MTLFALSFFLACSGGSADVATPAAAPSSAVPDALVAQTWQARLAADAARAPFEGRGAWVEVFSARWATALPQFASENDAQALARMHASYAAIYREAARLSANATVQVYGADAQSTDPAEASYLLGVSGALLADPAWRGKLGGAAASKVKGAAGALADRDSAWTSWASAGAAWPPPETLSYAPPASTDAGTLPDAGAVPHWSLPERDSSGLSVDAGDPAAMWTLAVWHEARARASDPALAPLVDAWIDPWRLPSESVVGPAASLTAPDAFLFLSPYTTGDDVAFLSDLAKSGPGAVATWADRSPYAAIAKACTVSAAAPAPTTTISVDCVLDQSAALGGALVSAMEKTAGQPADFHRAFADLARVGVLRAADRVALAMGDTDASGRLRINALDRSTGVAREPLFLLSVAAWDAGNRNSVRAQELVHGLLTQVPGLEAARLPLDALHIRLSRNAAPSRPMH
jgi:hypothetical protein